jgi:hypothetical protein
LTGAGIAAALASEFEDEIDGLSESIHDSLRLPDLPGPSDWNWPLGSKNPPGWLPDFLGGPGPDMSNPFGLTPEEGRAALAKFLSPYTVPKDKFATNVEERTASRAVPALPDTAMLPFVDSIGDLKTNTYELSVEMAQALARLRGFDQRPMGPPLPPTGKSGFVETVKLDPSQVSDIREPTRIAAEQLRASEMAAGTRHSTQLGRLATIEGTTRERLTALAGKYDVQNANSSTANRVLSSINAKTPPTHPVTVNNSISIPVSISATLIEQRLVTARLASVGIPTAPTLL